MKTRQAVLKTILWAIVGALAVVSVFRFRYGLGAATGLTDATPWGLWIAFDVMAGVALAAGGFTLAATVYIFGRRRFQPFARPAILTAFLGYAAVAFGLLYDLGLPWHIWHPIIHPQLHSVLFEVAMCVMLYLTVLFLEFSPVILEHPRFNDPVHTRIRRFLKRMTIPLVIAGIVLSTLHQSSLGSLFLIVPHRLHPLWYSPIIWILFFISAVGLGLMIVTLESYFSAWFFGHRLKMRELAFLGRAASIVLLIYAGLRLVDLAARGQLGGAFDGSWQAGVFILELAMGALIPAFLLLARRVRESKVGLGISSFLVVMGMIGYRFDVCIVAFARPEGMSYFPSWLEVAVSAGIVSGALIVFIFFVEHLKVYADEHPEEPEVEGAPEPPAPARPVFGDPAFDPATVRLLLPEVLRAPKRYSLAFVTAVAVAIAILPRHVLQRNESIATPVAPIRTVDGIAVPRTSAPGHDFSVARASELVPVSAVELPLLLIDGNRNGRLVLFNHNGHAAHFGGESSCVRCHHQNLPFDRNTSCYQCHSDMYTATDIFDHGSHVEMLGGNHGCQRCHQDPEGAKTRLSATACRDCHARMVVAGSVIEPAAEGLRGYAPGYMDAMHGLCITCHREELAAGRVEFGRQFTECAFCHRDVDGTTLRQMAPYTVDRAAGDGRHPVDYAGR